MNDLKLFKFKNRLKMERIIKSILLGVSSSIILNSLVIVIFKRIPLTIIVWPFILSTVLFSALFTYLSYLKIFKITTKQLVNRLEDNYKLDERVKTMYELRNIDTPIANIQRQSTIEYLEKVDEKELKYKFSFKNFISIFVAALLVVASILLPNKQITPDAGITTPPVVEDDLKVVVSYYNNEELIIDIEIDKGSRASSFTPTMHNSDFIGWYVDANFSEKHDFSTIVNEDISLFARFRKFYVVGEGGGILSSNTLDSSTILKYDLESQCFTITLDLNQGDQFMFASTLDFDFPRGYSYLLTTADNEGKERFSEGQSIGFETYIKVEEKGKYVFYLKTNPDSDEYDTENINYSNENKEQFNFNTLDSISFEIYTDQEDEQIKDSIDKIQQEVQEDENLNDENKEEIDKELEDLENNLQNSENKDEQQEQIDQSKEDINESIDNQISKDEIGEALKKQEGLENLGDNVSEGNSENTNQSLDDLRKQLENLSGDELKEALKDLSNKIDQALQDSNVDSSDELYKAFENMSNNLKQDAENVNDSDIQDQIDETFEQAKQEISNALENQNQLEDLKQSINDQLDDLKQQMGQGNNQNGENQDQNNNQEGNGEGQDSEEGEQTGENPGGNGAGDGDGELIYASDDLIYDPNTNSYVTYGELLNYYYEKAIQGIEEGQIPEDLESLINDYFASLWSDENN